ncbi:unnamed protein product [Mytilus coruscus]|uniref:Uncharacterized protein n=1 Tax=Mytilus coruscus TaxID=42192 RepID=A0A6J8B228_MYTCO|nr:unnamed protein product [Mytilus coruscus]
MRGGACVTSNRKVCRVVNGKCKPKSADCSALGSGFETYSPGNCCGKTKCCAPCDAACTHKYGGNCVLESECNMIKNSSLCTSCDGLICCIPSPVSTAQWIGIYTLSGDYIAFEMTLTFDGGRITGQGSEDIGAFTIDGTFVANTKRIVLIKRFTNMGTDAGYFGSLIANGQTISGRWQNGQINGVFRLNRAQ